MWALLLTLLLLALFPILLAVLFRETLLERKQKAILDDLGKLGAFELPLVKRKGGESGIREEIEGYYSRSFLFPPAILLSVLYLPGFLLCNEFMSTKFDAGHTSWPFYANLTAVVEPILFAFIGVYLFNMGTMVRRLYLSDLTENVFWGGINRLLLSMGVAIVLASGLEATWRLEGATSDTVFFAIGFLANAFLQNILQAGLRAGKIGKAKTHDVPLQMVRGINIWKEYRLEEEGIEDAQNLATADVIDLAVKTHYGLRTLIDWIDQAVLVVRLGEKKIQTLWELGVPVSAIDLAAQSPENTGNPAIAESLASKLEMEPLLMASLMNSLLEDEYIRTLWALWQTRPEAKRIGAAA